MALDGSSSQHVVGKISFQYLSGHITSTTTTPASLTFYSYLFTYFSIYCMEWPYLYLVVCPREFYVVLNVTTVMHECNCIYFKFFTSRKMGKTSLTFHFHTHLKFNAMEYNKLTDRGENATASSPSIFVWPEACPLGFCWDGTSPKFYQNTWKIQISLSVATCHLPSLP